MPVVYTWRIVVELPKIPSRKVTLLPKPAFCKEFKSCMESY